MSEVQAITQLSRDFKNQYGPFGNATLPEKRALDNISFNSDDLAVLSYGVMLDYNRSADQLWNNILELYNNTPEGSSYFHPPSVVEKDVAEMQETFEDIGFRYHHRDAQGWYDNSEILVEHFDGSWYKFLEHGDFDAVRLQQMLNDFGLKYLKGVKLAPFWLKVVDANIVSLERVWELDIPVDVHIRRLTIALSGVQMTDDEIRDFWRRYGKKHSVDPMAVDTALWLIGNNWDDWGEDYFEGLK